MPWGRLDDSLYDHPKLDDLPVERRLEGVGLWARSISWCNRFLTDGHVPRERIAKLDGTIELAELLVAAGMFDLNGSGYIVHDFLDFNDSRVQIEERRRKEAERKANWRAGRRPGGTDDGTSNGDEPNVPPGVPPSVPGGVPAGRTEMSRRPSRDSRGRSTRESRPDPSRPDPSESLHEEDPAPARGKRAGRPDVEALHAAGFPKVSKAQRAVLDEIASRHDETGYAFAAQAIANAPEGSDPLAAAMSADRLWQEAQRRRADAEEAGWSETKRRERAELGRPDWAGGET